MSGGRKRVQVRAGGRAGGLSPCIKGPRLAPDRRSRSPLRPPPPPGAQSPSARGAPSRADMGGGMLSRLLLGVLLLSVLLIQQMHSQPVSTPSAGGATSVAPTKATTKATTKGGGSALQSAGEVILLSLSLLFQLYCWESQAEKRRHLSRPAFQTRITWLLDVQCGKENNRSSSGPQLPLRISCTDSAMLDFMFWRASNLTGLKSIWRRSVTQCEICGIVCTRLKEEPIAKISEWSNVINRGLKNMDSYSSTLKIRIDLILI